MPDHHCFYIQPVYLRYQPAAILICQHIYYIALDLPYSCHPLYPTFENRSKDFLKWLTARNLAFCRLKNAGILFFRKNIECSDFNNLHSCINRWGTVKIFGFSVYYHYPGTNALGFLIPQSTE